MSKIEQRYTLKNTRDIKFTKLTDLEPVYINNLSEEEKNSEIVITSKYICDSVKNSLPYKELVCALSISTYEK